MANIQKDILFDHFISGMEKEMQATLRMMYLNSCNIDEANRRREMEQMKEEIVQDVLFPTFPPRWTCQRFLTQSTA